MSILDCQITATVPELRTCSLCTHRIAENFEGICGRCEADMCQECNEQGNECKHCTDEAAQAHGLHQAEVARWASLAETERSDAISRACDYA